MTPPTLSPDTLEALKRLREECPMPFVLDEDNKSHVVVKDCCSGEVMSSHLPMIGVNIFMQESHLRARLVARLLVALSQDPNLQN